MTDAWLKNFSESGTGQLKTLTNSMSPLIRAGDFVCIKKVTVLSTIRIGDILAFWKGNMLVTHRVIRKINKNNAVWFLERSDRVPQTSWVSPETVIGRVTRIRKKDVVIDLETGKMKLYSKGIGLVFLSEWILRLYGRRVKGPFAFFKTAAKYFYIFLKKQLHRLMIKSVNPR